MRFLVDRCAGRKLADWLRSQNHDVFESRTLGADPGDRQLLEKAVKQERVLVTIDNDLPNLSMLTGRSTAGSFGCRTYLLTAVLN